MQKFHIDHDRDVFFSYVVECNNKYRDGHDLDLYRKIIQEHRTNKGISSLLDDNSFISMVWDTLEAWNMNQRGARLVSPDIFMKSILNHRELLIALYHFELHTISRQQIDHGLRDSLYSLFCGLEVMETKRRIVGVSKAMHFLLPDLVIPMDGNYTLRYFKGYNKYDDSTKGEFDMFEYIFRESHRISVKLSLSPSDVDHKGWNTTIPKLIDNAIIGFYKRF